MIYEIPLIFSRYNIYLMYIFKKSTHMDEIRNTILKVEELKAEKKFSRAISLLQKTLIKYSDDYRLYEELADIYLYI